MGNEDGWERLKNSKKERLKEGKMRFVLLFTRADGRHGQRCWLKEGKMGYRGYR